VALSGEGGGELGLGPALLYPAKAALTRARSLAWLARTRGAPRRDGLRILFYHRVSDDRDELAVPPARFEAQIERLVADGWDLVDVVTAARRMRSGEPVGATLGLSFDDGYLDVAEHALPVLERHGCTATVFVATGAIDGDVRFSWYERQPPLMSWDDVARLDGGTLRFEAHTVTHPNLVAVPDDVSRAEIVDGKHRLEERLGREVTAFCYPAGLFGAREREYVAAAGFEIAVSCEPGVNTQSTDPLALRRLQVDARDGVLDVRAKAAGGLDAPPPLRAAWRRARYGAGGGSPRSESAAR
jgi:peptidoglycan/xylan/chitin deacetylase (PgdA/CDA1 family)